MSRSVQSWSLPPGLGLAGLGLVLACSDTGPRPAPPASSGVSGWWRDVTHEVGLDHVHESGARGRQHLPEVVGSGVALLDADGDGDLDVYLVNGRAELDAVGAERNRLFLQAGDGSFADATDSSGLGDRGYGMGVAVGDVDNDGDLDVYVSNFGEDRLYRNRGEGTFEDVTAAAGIQVPGWSASAAFLDYDLDGLLDLYVAQYVEYDREKVCTGKTSRPDYCPPRAYPAARDVLLHNLGGARFSDVSLESGIAAVAYAGLGVVTDDFDGDGSADLYVANDTYPNLLWLNQGDGTFVDGAPECGLDRNLDGRSEAGMGIARGDLDGDGELDLFVTHLRAETNTLYLRTGRGDYDDATGRSALGGASLPYTGFGTCAIDVELDGDLDLCVANGRVTWAAPLDSHGVMDSVPERWVPFAEPNLFFLNDGAGRFASAPLQGGEFCASLEVSRALAFGDLDRDGDLDLVLTNTDGPARVYRNEAPREGRWLAVRCVDPDLRREAVGALVTVEVGERSLRATVSRASSFLASNAGGVHFGLGAAAAYDSIEVRWPGGAREAFPGGAADRALELVRGTGVKR